MAHKLQGFRYKAERPRARTFVEQKWGYTGERAGGGRRRRRAGEATRHATWAAHPPGLILPPPNASAALPTMRALAGGRPQRWPLRCVRAGAWMELQVGTEESPGSRGEATVHLGYLKSYLGMGAAVAECKVGCTCKRSLMDGLWNATVSLIQMHSFQVRVGGGEQLRCGAHALPAQCTLKPALPHELLASIACPPMVPAGHPAPQLPHQGDHHRAHRGDARGAEARGRGLQVPAECHHGALAGGGMQPMHPALLPAARLPCAHAQPRRWHRCRWRTLPWCSQPTSSRLKTLRTRWRHSPAMRCPTCATNTHSYQNQPTLNCQLPCVTCATFFAS